MAGTKTDNHFTADKIDLRVEMTAHLQTVRVLDVFGGHGVVWGGVERISGRKVIRTAVDKRTDLDRPHLHGDNEKIIGELDLSRYDVIDLDAYGIPAGLIKTVLQKGFKGPVFVTAIQTMQGGMPKVISDDIGLPPTLMQSCNSLIGRRGWEYLKNWLALQGVDEIIHRSYSRKHYFGFYANGFKP